MVRITLECAYVILFLLGFLHGVDLARWLLDHRSFVASTFVAFLLEVVHLLAVVTDGALLVIRISRLRRLPGVVGLASILPGPHCVDVVDGVDRHPEVLPGLLELHYFIAHLGNVGELRLGHVFLCCGIETPVEKSH